MLETFDVICNRVGSFILFILIHKAEVEKIVNIAIPFYIINKITKHYNVPF